MMAAERTDMPLIERLPAVRGRLRADEPMAKYTWFRVGGPAQVLYEPADLDDLTSFLGAADDDIPVTVIGGTSNILIRDGGIPGVVIRLGKGFAGIDIDGEAVRVGAAAADVHVARKAADAGIAGLEFLVGIPGVIGGALRMNAGAYGAEVADVFVEATAVHRSGVWRNFDVAAMGFSYRHTGAPADVIFTHAILKGAPDDAAAIHRRMAEISETRESTQPVRTRTGGSTFANPDGHKAWQLVDQAGCRGLTVGGAMVSEDHCNFLINTATATAADLERLGEEVRRRVMETTGVELRWEIRRLGVPADRTLTEVPL